MSKVTIEVSDDVVNGRCVGINTVVNMYGADPQKLSPVQRLAVCLCCFAIRQTAIFKKAGLFAGKKKVAKKVKK
jgi:hypothetical protein